MTKLEALKQMLSSIEGGAFDIDLSARDMGLPGGDDGLPIIKQMFGAYNGSRDAAKSLRDKFFDGWHVIIWGHDEYLVTLQNPKARHVRHNAKSTCEARAELMAILKGLIAQEEAE